MDPAELLGWVAVLFTLTAFSMRTMLPLRVAAIGSNICFIGFGYLDGTLPILALHALLLPFNLMRLRQIVLTMREVGRQNALSLQEKMASISARSPRSPSHLHGNTAVPTGYLGSAESAQNVSAAEFSEHRSREIAELRAEIAALREQLRRSTSHQTITKGSTNYEAAEIDFWDGPSSRTATF